MAAVETESTGEPNLQPAALRYRNVQALDGDCGHGPEVGPGEECPAAERSWTAVERTGLPTQRVDGCNVSRRPVRPNRKGPKEAVRIGGTPRAGRADQFRPRELIGPADPENTLNDRRRQLAGRGHPRCGGNVRARNEQAETHNGGNEKPPHRTARPQAHPAIVPHGANLRGRDGRKWRSKLDACDPNPHARPEGSTCIVMASTLRLAASVRPAGVDLGGSTFLSQHGDCTFSQSSRRLAPGLRNFAQLSKARLPRRRAVLRGCQAGTSW